MNTLTLPFSIRYRKPFWLLMSPQDGQTAVYSVHAELMADQASDALVSFVVENFVELFLWADIHGPMRPRQMAAWMTEQSAERCMLFALRDVYTPTPTVIATPNA